MTRTSRRLRLPSRTGGRPLRIAARASYGERATAHIGRSLRKGAFMSSRKHLRHGLLVAALGAFGLALHSARAAADDSSPRADAVIVAQGTGEVSVRPDSVRVELTVEAQTDTLDAATSRVSTAM